MFGIRAKLAFYFVLLGLLPAAAALIGLSALTVRDQRVRIDTRLDTELGQALSVYAGRLRAAETQAAAIARGSDLARAVRAGDETALRQFVARRHDVAVEAGGARFGALPRGAATRSANLRYRGRLLARVLVAVPLDDTSVASLRLRAAVDPGDTVAVLRGRSILAASPPLAGAISVLPARPSTVTVGAISYRGLARPPLVVLGPPPAGSLLDGSNRWRLGAVLFALLAIVGLAAYAEGRAIVGDLGRLVAAVGAIGQGRLEQRVDVRGRDELATLGRAFNEMAEQLERRIGELDEERRRLGTAIERIGETLGATHDPTHLLEVLVDTVREATGAAGVVLVTDDDRITSGDVEAAGRQQQLPLDRFGTLTLTGSFSDEQFAVATSLAAQAVVALENARLHTIVAREASVDALTGLANRRQLERSLAREIARAQRIGEPLSLIVADLDDFKRINDVHGHATGDAVLRSVATTLERTLRAADTCGRWGGEEFVAVLPGADTAGALHLAERLREAVAAEPIADVHVTASVGVASYGDGITTGDELFVAADAALYDAKAAGKNRVVAASGASS